MKIDMEKLRALCALSDEELWREIRTIAGKRGLTLPEATPPHSEMERLRGAMSGGGGMNLMGAMRVINEYKRGKR